MAEKETLAYCANARNERTDGMHFSDQFIALAQPRKWLWT